MRRVVAQAAHFTITIIIRVKVLLLTRCQAVRCADQLLCEVLQLLQLGGV